MLTVLLIGAIAQAQAPPRDTRVEASATATIAGTVVSEEAPPRPLRRARVTLSGQSLDGDLVAIAGDDGAFAFEGLAPGAYSLSASKAAYVTMAYGASRPGRAGVPVAVAVGAVERVTFRLPRGAVVTGMVTDADGTPVPGMDVTVLERRQAFGGVRFVSVGTGSIATDDHGVYRVYGVPAGDYIVAARPALRDPLRIAARPDRRVTLAQVFHPSTVDPSRATRLSVRAGEERSGIDIQLQYVPLASVSGVVTTASGFEPAEVVAVPAGEIANPGTSMYSTRANDAGRFFFSNMPAGAYRIVALSRGATGALSGEAAVVLDGDVDNLALSLQPPLSITGSAVFRGDSRPPVFGTSRSTPTVVAALTDAVAAMPRMDIDGVRFRIEGILPGPFRVGGNMMGIRTPIANWWLTSIAANGVELFDAPLGISASIDNAIATFSDRASHVGGTVTGRGGVAGPATVVAFSTDRQFWFAGSRRVAGTRTDDNGRYRILNLPPGAYLIAAVTDLAEGEWSDPAVLDRLVAGAVPFTVTGTETQAHDLRIR